MKTKSLILFLFLTLTVQLNLIPDSTNPLLVLSQYPATITVFEIKFTFPSTSIQALGPEAIGSYGLTYNQYFGLKFPSTMATNLNFDDATPQFSCALSNEFNSFTMLAKPSEPKPNSANSAEKNIAFCQMTDVSTNVPLPVGGQYTYTLKITFDFKITTQFIKSLSLFTATANNPDRIIIDSLPLLGSVALYNDWTTSTPIPLKINSGSVSVKKPLDSPSIYPYSTFDVSLVLQTSEFITAKDYLIVINFPAATVSAPQTVDSTEAAPSNVNQIALQGQLTLSQLGSNGVLLLGGVSEDLIPNRTFKLNLKGWTALSTDLGTLRSIQVLVYYKNTYSVFSYSTYPLIEVKKATLSLSANHPEFWDIYRNAAWPVKFKFSSNTDIGDSNGVYVVIRQNNSALSSNSGGNLVTFVASTCDFSNTNSISANYGARPTCFPLRLDHNYPNTASTFNGSGIFFFINGPITASDFYVNVWIYADICGGNRFNNIIGAAFVVPTFEVSVHNSIDTNKLNESRFDFTKEIAVGSGSFAGKCWNNKIQSFTVQAGQPDQQKNTAGDNNFRSDLDDDLAGAHRSMTLRLKEITSWHIGSNTNGACTSCFEADISTTLVEKFLYSNNNKITDGSFFTAVAPLNLQENYKLSTGLPGSVITSNIPGTLTVQFSKMWFTGTNDFQHSSTNSCFLSWALQNPPSATPLNYSSLTKNIATSTDKNFIASKRSGTSVSDFDENASLLVSTDIDSASNIMKLVSKFNSAQPSDKWLYFSNEVPALKNTNVAWYTNCIKWNTKQTIKSLYTYIDIQFIWTYTTNTSSGIFSNVRLIKLFPEGGVFNDNVEKVSGGTNVNPYVNHVVLANDSDTFSPVCLIEINGLSIINVDILNSNSNVFAIWLGFGVLLETDYSDASATYPAGPVLSNANTYGLQSQIPMNPGNLYVSTDYNNGATPENVPLYVTLNQLQDPAVFDNSATAAAPKKGENSSSYQFLMGSLVLFTGLTRNGLQPKHGPLFIPYYCPYAYPDTNTAERKYLNFVPSIFAAWLSMPNYSEVNGISSYLYYGTNDNGNLKNKMSILLSRNSSNSNTIKTGPFKGDSETSINKITTTNKKILGTLRWNAYTDLTNTANIINVFNGNRDPSYTNPSVTCTGFSVFLNLSSVQVASTISFSALTNGKNGYYNSSKVFYVMGKPFTHAAYWGGLSYSADGTEGNMAFNSPTTTTPSLTITGIPRQTINTFISSTGVLTVSNKVAFSCVPAHSSAYDALTNYFYKDGNSNFILDWAPSSSNWVVSINYDNSNVSQDDIAGNAAFDITSPSLVPQNSEIQFSSTTFNENTICGIVTQNSIASDCYPSAVNVNQFNCPVKKTAKKFNICCYNIIIDSSIDISALSANFVTEPLNASLQTYILQDVYDASSQINSSPFSYTIDNAALTDIIRTLSSTISDIAYKHNNQADGFGSIQMTINLARQLLRNMKINISGDFSHLLIRGNSPRCFVSASNSINFGEKWDDGDVLINACNVSIDMKTITILTKNFIYKCGTSYSTILYLTLSPVVVADWNDNSLNQNFKVNLSLIDGSAVALNDDSLALSLATPVTTKPIVSGQWDTLCSVYSVVPRIPGEIAEYVFEIDLDTSKIIIANSLLNEVTIFWPYQYYGSFLENIYCFSGKLLLNCYFSGEGIMNIVFPIYLPIEGKVKVSVTGVPNPEIIGDYSFPCTVNNYDLTTLTRTNVITGSGLLKNGITGASILNNQYGNLRFFNIANPVTYTTSPRKTSTHIFRVAFDKATGLTPLPLTINNNLVIHIYFPNDYNFPWYSDIPTATVLVYNHDIDYKITSTSFPVSNVSVSGNRITITITETSVVFNTDFVYSDISLTNIANPSDSTLTTTPPVKITTLPYLITLTNSDESVLYKTYTNINTYSTDQIGSSVVNTVNWSRGNSFAYDNTRWILDIYTDSTQTNKVLLKPGRYSVSYFNVRASTNKYQVHTTANLSLPEGTFKTSQKTYMVSTAIMTPIPFLIGCTCLTSTGEYIINFTSNNEIEFTRLSPVVVIVDNSNYGTIEFNANNSVPPAGSLSVPVSIYDYNFDPININWTGDITNDVTDSINNIIISPAVNISGDVQMNIVFGIKNAQSTLAQTFTASNTNSCYQLASNTISFAISGTLATVPPSGPSLYSNFLYANSKIDNALEKNSVKFIFTPPEAPIFMYCALTSINSPLPADSDIINPTLTNSNLLQFSSYQFLNTNPTTLVFSNLVRGQQYKLRCILKSTQADSTLRTQDSITLETAKSTNALDSTIYSIIPEPAEPTNCIQFNFVTNPGQETRDAILNYCQNFFSKTGWYINGCIICTTPDVSATIGGLEFSQNSKSTTTIIKQTAEEAYVVCPVPTSTCSTNAGPTFTYTTLFSQFKNNLNTNSLLSAAIDNPNVELSLTSPIVTLLDDNSKLDITQLAVLIGSRNRFGQFRMTATYPTPALCYWKISYLSTPPSFASIRSCTDLSWCGIAEVGPIPFNIEVLNLREFAYDTTYYVHYGCSNDAPFTTSTSDVVSVANFLYKSKPILKIIPLAASTLNLSITTLFSLIVMILLI